jgi:hypothetical protein
VTKGGRSITTAGSRRGPFRGKFGAQASKLLPLLAQGHYDVKLSPDDLRRMVVWLDANSDFFGAYENTQAQARGETVRPKLQ